jgi:hypothetical protein
MGVGCEMGCEMTRKAYLLVMFNKCGHGEKGVVPSRRVSVPTLKLEKRVKKK